MKLTQFVEWFFRSPFLWMTLLGVVSAHSIKRYKHMVSLPYAPLIEENEDYTRSQLVLSFLAGAIGSVLLYYTNTVLDLSTVIGIWLIITLFMMAKKDPIVLLATSFIIVIVLYSAGARELAHNAIRYCAVYQIIMGGTYLLGKKDTYPIMQQDKDGNIFGEHIYNRIWLFPVIAFTTMDDMYSYITYVFLVMLLISNVRINKENVNSYFRRHGLFMTITGALIFAISFIQIGIVEIILAFGIIPCCIVVWVVREVLFTKTNDYYFVASDKGVQVLYVYDNTPASKMKIEIGDIILGINGRRVITENAMKVVLDEYPPFVWLEIQRGKEIFEVEYKDYKKGINCLGAVYTSRNPSKFEVYPNRSLFKNLIYRCLSIFKH